MRVTLTFFYAREEASIHDMFLQIPGEFHHAVATREVQLAALENLHVLASSSTSAVNDLMCKTLVAPMTFLKAMLEDEPT